MPLFALYIQTLKRMNFSLYSRLTFVYNLHIMYFKLWHLHSKC